MGVQAWTRICPQSAPAAASTHRYVDLDEMVVSIPGRRMYLWRAVDSEGEILDILVQAQQGKAAALRLMRKLLKKQGIAPSTLVTDSCCPTERPDGTWVSQLTINGACARTIARKTRTRWCDDENGNSKASSLRAQPSAFYRCSPQLTTHSTFSATSSPVVRCACSEWKRLTNG